MKRPWTIFAVSLLALGVSGAAQITVPIYLEDSHAGSFYWLAQHLDLEEPCTLLHFDTHSDASAVFDSDKLRARLRRVGSLGERTELLQHWREQGAVQCFGWIEPLLPSPVSEVVWIPRATVSPGDRQQMEESARQLLDGDLEASPRTGGSFKQRLRVSSLDELERNYSVGGAVIVRSISITSAAWLRPSARPSSSGSGSLSPNNETCARSPLRSRART